MNEIELTYLPYSLNFIKPFRTSKGVINKRKGFIIRLKSSSGKTGIGDATPFNEFGTETFEDAENFLNNLQFRFKIDLDDILNSVDENLKVLINFPALRHGFEQALLNLICNEKNISLNELLNVGSRKEIKINCVIGFLSPKDSASVALDKIKEGFTTIKVKIGRDSFEEDYACLKSVHNVCGNEIKIRADVNGKWNLKEAENNLKQLEEFNIEYIEQPVNSLQDFIKLSSLTKIPLAADESIRNYKDAENFISHNAASVLILKPMILGGIIPAMQIKNFAEKNNIKVVISSSFESVIGRSFAIFAASTIKEEIAHGLDTSGYFESDLTEDPYKIVKGVIKL